MGTLRSVENVVDLIGFAAAFGAPLWWPIVRLLGLPLFDAKARRLRASSVAWYLFGAAMEGAIIAIVVVLKGASAILLGPLVIFPVIALVLGVRRDPLLRSSP